MYPIDDNHCGVHFCFFLFTRKERRSMSYDKKGASFSNHFFIENNLVLTFVQQNFVFSLFTLIDISLRVH